MDRLTEVAKLIKEMTYDELKSLTETVITEPLHSYYDDLEADKRGFKENVDFDYFAVLFIEWADGLLPNGE